jgi:predicted Zn-ribbon and HTH transcriptional regulator
MEPTVIREGDEHFTYPVECRACQWVGFGGDLMASGKKPKPYCPKCGSMEIGDLKIVNT